MTDFELEKLDDNVYEIPQDDEMNAPARVYASEKLLDEIKQDKTLQQVRNVATMPGIVEHSIVLPDGHQGYGFPIGGVAAFDADDGIISPGGIGYDINCLTGDSEVTMEFGRRRRIGSLRDDFAEERAVVAADGDETSEIRLFTEGTDTVYEVETETGETVRSTADHPFLTPEGMVELDGIDEGDEVFVRPLVGVEDEKPEEFVVLEESDLVDEDPQLIAALKQRDLLPLRSTDREFAVLLKLLGYHMGDGSYNSHSETTFYGDEEALCEIQDDIRELGYEPSRVYSRDREHEANGNEFETTEHSVKSTANSFQQLLVRLGSPKGKKTKSDYTLPPYFDRLAGWQKALFLSTLFGAEMSAPAAQTGKCLYSPTFSHSRAPEHREAGEVFVRGLTDALEGLGVETNPVERSETETGNVRLRFGVKNDTDNLLRFFSRVGYRYAPEKRREAAVAVQYLKCKERNIQGREQAECEAVVMYDGGASLAETNGETGFNDRSVEKTVYGGRDGRPRPSEGFPDYDEFRKDTEVHDGYRVKTKIESVEKVGERHVYDIGVTNDAHRFVADGFVVSNCGVRLLQTDLDYEDIRGKEETVVNALYDAVPCGLGKGGYLDIDKDDLCGILEGGVEWMVKNGHARKEDLRRCEENGRLPGDASKVPQEALDRGVNQVGSLGSGNHFLEVQRVADIFDEPAAEAFGLREDGVVVMVHSGSRGLGHQTCTEYLRRFEKTYPERTDQLLDRELVHAPIADEVAQDYRDAMYAAANFAWANRQAMTQAVRHTLDGVFGGVETRLVYDVCHNVAKEETHTVDGENRDLLVHRKGATRAFPPGREEVPDVYAEVGQPVLIPGSMGAGSYVLKGGEESLERSFGSTAHGAGRLMSRTQAKQDFWGGDVQDELREEDVYVKAESGATIAEEAPGVYKDIDEVIRISDELGIGQKVARTRPIANIKG
jgi:tRNA-splicing ligase RtcB